MVHCRPDRATARLPHRTAERGPRARHAGLANRYRDRHQPGHRHPVRPVHLRRRGPVDEGHQMGVDGPVDHSRSGCSALLDDPARRLHLRVPGSRIRLRLAVGHGLRRPEGEGHQARRGPSQHRHHALADRAYRPRHDRGAAGHVGRRREFARPPHPDARRSGRLGRHGHAPPEPGPPPPLPGVERHGPGLRDHRYGSRPGADWNARRDVEQPASARHQPMGLPFAQGAGRAFLLHDAAGAARRCVHAGADRHRCLRRLNHHGHVRAAADDSADGARRGRFGRGLGPRVGAAAVRPLARHFAPRSHPRGGRRR